MVQWALDIPCSFLAAILTSLRALLVVQKVSKLLGLVQRCERGRSKDPTEVSEPLRTPILDHEDLIPSGGTRGGGGFDMSTTRLIILPQPAPLNETHDRQYGQPHKGCYRQGQLARSVNQSQS